MKRLFILLALVVMTGGYFTSCSEDEVVNPTEEGGTVQESPDQWDV